MNKLWNCSKAYRLLYDTISSTKSCGLPISQSTRLTAAVPSFAVASRHIGQHSSPLSHLLVRTPASTTALCRGLFAPHIPASVSLWLLARRSVSTSTNIAKDVIIFKYENPRFFKLMNIFAYCQFIFWSYLAHFAYTELRNVPVDEDVVADEESSWWQKLNLGEDKYRIGMTVFSLGVGYVILSLAWLYTLRSVRFLVLRKGGQTITMVTYGPFGRNRMMNVPVNCISAQESRQNAKVTLPLKLKGARMYYMLDMRGEFLNTQLFDHTVGLKRKF